MDITVISQAEVKINQNVCRVFKSFDINQSKLSIHHRKNLYLFCYQPIRIELCFTGTNQSE